MKFKNNEVPNHMAQDGIVPVVFHNLSKFDSHVIIRDINKYIPGSMTVLPTTKESYIAFTKFVDNTNIQLRFIDSYRFLSESLGKLISYLDENEMPLLDNFFTDLTDEKKRLLTRKGVFPYDYIDSMAKLDETELPKIEDFHSLLNDEECTKEDHDHGKAVWTLFEITTMKEYALLYLKLDIILLAEIFENFRKSCMQSYKLDVAHYFSLPGNINLIFLIIILY